MTIDEFFADLDRQAEERVAAASAALPPDPDREARRQQIDSFRDTARKYAARLRRHSKIKVEVGASETAVIFLVKGAPGRPYFHVRQGILPFCLSCRVGNDNETRDLIGSELILRSDFGVERYEELLQRFLTALLFGDETALLGFGKPQPTERAKR